MRLYVPATLDELDALTGPDAVLPTPRRAHAVTPRLRTALPDEDEEGQEFAAQLMAADDALVLLASRPGAPTLRLVVTVEVADSVVAIVPPREDEPVSLVTLAGPLLADDVVCALVDEPAARAQVVRALDGDDDALEALAEQDLLWYDVTELGRIPR